MVFSSPIFLFQFLPLTLAVYYLAGTQFRNAVLTVASLLFYAWGEPRNVLVMLASIVLNYVLGLLLERSRTTFGKRLCLLLAVCADLGILFYFKYFNFFVDNLNGLFALNIAAARIALPIGISFYTFQIMSYVIDVHRGEVKAQRSIVSLAMYISMFPQLIAGPIVRYSDVEKQIVHRELSVDKFYSGLLVFMTGFIKKVLIADQLAPLADAAFSSIGVSCWLSWLGLVAYALQIYYDFSGYSDMAIGLGRMLGFEFMQNFNYPYISRSVREFWRRWHISLSTWFRDYVYIPLGGSRRGSWRTYVNLLITFFLTGFWHGASYNFIVWGLYFGVFLIAERFWGDKLSALPLPLQHLYALAVVLFGWIFFRAETLGAAVLYWRSLFVPGTGDMLSLLRVLTPQSFLFMTMGIVFACPLDSLRKKSDACALLRICRVPVLFFLFLLAILFMTGTGFSPFLYFRF